ncbi:hypothetical protein [Thermotalea metallivorans]|uniref:Uncharacterized protein n=1 Tax=Thermotalea metallivorans TaxID=520762 RepID=A0A140L7J3_9FIRM|nr:hypothetical protein [Thermotalea metallivorans]KXG76518.1 hypothetical protein AN619_10490 [Thermotalea metallivorans]
MMNINCALNCCFQNDGKCALTHIIFASSSPHPECVYFRPKDEFHGRTPLQNRSRLYGY